MAIKLKSKREIELIRRAGAVVRQVLERLGAMAAPGVTTAMLDAQAERLTRELGAQALFKGVPGRGGPFPGTSCISINEQLVHGIPSERAFRAGDIVSIDYGCRLDGYCADAAVTCMVGKVPQEVRRLVAVTRRMLDMAVELSRPGPLWSELAGRMQQYVEGEGFSVVREFVGHGIGKEMWEDPKVPNFVSPDASGRDFRLEEGLVIAVEPMVTMGSREVVVEADGWTVVTRDGKPSAHFEHTLAITADGAEVLTA